MRILIAEDDKHLAEQLRQHLGAADYSVDVASDGEEASFLGDTEPYEAVVLDLGLPVQDGLSVLRHWRANGRSMPVLILTARSSWHDKVSGLDAGADDYLAKPFSMEELLARLRALLRRAHGVASPMLACGSLKLYPKDASVTIGGDGILLTSHEFKVLHFLMLHKDRIVSRSELIEQIYAQDFDRDSNTVEVFIARLRKKLGPEAILTIRGMGYQMGLPQ